MKKNLIFQQLFEANSSTYTYLLADAHTKESILIDSVLETVDRDLKLIEELGLNLKYVLDTHVHADHVTGAGEIRNRVGAKTAVAKKANVPCVDLQLAEGDEVKFGEFTLKALETPGHTDSSLSFYIENMIFSGDALLIRGCGRTDFQGGSAEKLYESVTGKLFKLPPNTIVYPAHDYQGFTSSTIESEMAHNPRLGKNKSKEQFVEIMANLNLAYPKMIDIALPANQTCGLMDKSETAKHNSIPSITVEELASRKNPNALLIDVRRADEYQGELGHIAGSHLITLGDRFKTFLESYDRSEEIIFICRSGQRSAEATKLGIQMGFKNVANLVGGMKRWNECAYPVQR
jgi:glyoxylase-like metal-dependent hydrolase (beta-lactamase superfamily II)/rhodanese-related sulfurtransferase